MSNADVYDSVTARMVAALESGTAPWRRPWSTSAGAGMPRSLSTGKPYRGLNVLLLGLASADAGYSSPWWGTYRQVSERGGQVRRGERSTEVVLWKPATKRVTDADTGDTESHGYLLARTFRVFNADQCDGLDAYKVATEPRTDLERIDACETISAGYADTSRGPSLKVGGDRAYYSPGRDMVGIPTLGSFISAEHYYSTLFHELTHSTGAASRLNRPELAEGHAFGDPSYSREELVAEIGAAMLCAIAGIDNAAVSNESAAYLASWVKVLRGDHRLIVSASGAAQRAADRILGTDAASDRLAPSDADDVTAELATV